MNVVREVPQQVRFNPQWRDPEYPDVRGMYQEPGDWLEWVTDQLTGGEWPWITLPATIDEREVKVNGMFLRVIQAGMILEKTTQNKRLSRAKVEEALDHLKKVKFEVQG